MDNSKIDQCTTDFATIILEETISITNKSIESSVVTIENSNIIMKEFLLFELHLCDRILFGFLGAELRKEIMERVITQIAVLLDESQKTALGEVLNKFKSIDKVLYKQKLVDTPDYTVDYLKRSRDVPTAEDLIDGYNQCQIEYSKYKLTKETEIKCVAGMLEYEFGKKLSSLLGHENEASYIELMTTWAKALFFKLLVKFRGILDKC